MDFCKLIHTAQKNEKTNNGVRYYSTKFEPPKKEQRSKQLSVNIKNFLAKKEEEEKRKALEEKRRKDELLALRSQDKKATRRVNVMLKRTKSANKSVLEEAVDRDDTAVTLAGPLQPDEDDYGYVSQEASAFYNKMMEKYSKMPHEPKFNLLKKKVSNNLNNTKDRVKAALEREKEEAMQPHKRKRKRKDNDDEPEEPERQENHKRDPPKKPKAKPAPPPMNFADLLKIAEKKQFEPIVIEQKPKEEEKLLTKKQKKELEREKEWRERKEAKQSPNNALEKKPTPIKIPKIENEKKPIEKHSENSLKMPKTKINGATNKPALKPIETSSKSSKINGSILNRALTGPSKEKPIVPRPIPSKDIKNKQLNTKISPAEVKRKDFPPKDLKPKQFPPPDVTRGRNFPPGGSKMKQFPPADVRRRDFPPKQLKKQPMVNRGRILDEDDSEYDSEMDDFIDDGPEEGNEYSNYIKEIFGYDKSRYKDMDDDVDNMESTFAQQMKEEVISTKIGIMEDLEDIKKEEEEKKRKALRLKGKR